MATDRPCLADLPGPRRLALGFFALGLLAFYAAAQGALFVVVGGARSYPSAPQVLHRYHGDPARSSFHAVLDPARPLDDPLRMYPFLGASEEECAQNRLRVLAWVESGAPRAGWEGVSDIFTGPHRCGLCHSAKPDDEGNPRQKAGLPFDTWEQAVSAARPDRGLSWADLAITTHNHLFGFLVASLLLSWAFSATRWRGALVPLLVVGAFSGALLDVAGWWLTKALGEPWHHLVLGGGALFGVAACAMAALVLDEVWFGSFVGRGFAKVLRPLRLGRLAD